MDHLWIGLSIFAALMQAVRTAAQRTLNQRLSALATTYVRALFGLPVMVLYLAALLAISGGGTPQLSARYLLYVFLGALGQVVATLLLIMMFRLKDFAVGTMLTKADIIITAIIGAVFFSERLSAGGSAALIVVTAGVLLLFLGRMRIGTSDSGRRSLHGAPDFWPLFIALMCALSFSFSYLFLREATLQLAGDALWRGAWTVVITTGMQAVGVGIWMWAAEPGGLALVWTDRKMSGFIGLTSALGSIAWFTAFALQNASYVRAVGQVEVVFTLAISRLYFQERITPVEVAGIVLTVAGVLMFRLVS